jgi:hypothetical protein
MNCHEADTALSEESPLLVQAQEHLRTCDCCRELLSVLNTREPANSPSPETLHKIAAGIAKDLRPVRPMAPSRHFVRALVAISISSVAINVYSMGAFGLAAMTSVQIAAILGTLTISAILLAYSLVNQIVPGSHHRISPRLLPVCILISLMIAVAVLFQFQHERNFWASGWYCLRVGTPIGILAAVPLWLLLRRGAILSPSMTGAATGLLAGLIGTSVLTIHCPNLDARHILVSHLGVAILCALAGFATGLMVEIIARASVERK